jgi:hypothetical protein
MFPGHAGQAQPKPETLREEGPVNVPSWIWILVGIILIIVIFQMV